MAQTNPTSTLSVAARVVTIIGMFGAFLTGAVSVWLGSGQAPPATAPAATVSAPAPVVPTVKGRRPRGAIPTPRAKIFAAAKHVKGTAPASFVPAVIPTPAQMSYWGNDVDGDCCTAEECFAKEIWSVYYVAAPLLDFPYALAVQWAGNHGFLSGAALTDVMDAMASSGMSYGGTTYTDGPYQAVDYTDWATLTSAISRGPVKVGLASSQFDAVAGVGERNGWVMTGLARDEAEDHCTSLCGYGSMQTLASAMGVSLPAGVNPSANGLMMFTWDSIGIIDHTSFVAITGEAWLRSPTTPQTPVPVPVLPVIPTPGPPILPATVNVYLHWADPSPQSAPVPR